MMFTVGLTGGIGSGKSTVTDLFAQLGVLIIDADVISHQLSHPPSPALDEVTKQFGRTYLTEEGSLNRHKMRELVFQDPLARQQLELIFHPLIHQKIVDTLQEADTAVPYAILAVPLLFESKRYQAIIDRSVVVDCPVELQIARTIARSSLSREAIEQIIATQISRAERLAQADDIITNDQDLSHLYMQITALHYRYLQFRVIKR
jgi:dephospho-CoA kinase